MDVSTILLNTQNPDITIRSQAEEQLNNALQSNMAQFMLTLTQALTAENFEPVGRQAAGLYLKNVLDAKDAQLQAQKAQTWLQMDETARSQIKQMALQVLTTQDATARHTGAQFVAKLGAIEVPHSKWPELLPTLLHNVTGGNEGTQHATLESLGYLCEGLEDEESLSQDDTNKILTAIVDGIRSDRPSNIRHAAVTALRNSLDFIGENFKREGERNHIMQVICEATQCPDIRVRVVAFECIASIAAIYYEYLSPYMHVLYNVTFKAVKEDEQDVGLQSLEFWSTVCDVELDIMEDAEIQDLSPDESCKYFIRQIRAELIPLLTETLMHQDEDQDEDTWNISMAGATCLGLVAQTIGDECVDITMSFVNTHISSQNWREKEAAIMAFGSILDGPTHEKVYELVRSGVTFLMQCMTDGNILVRDTTAWAIGRVCELHPTCIQPSSLNDLMITFSTGLNDDPRVSHNICYAIHNLVKATEDAADDDTNALSPYFVGMFDKLLETANRADWAERNLRGASYEALNMLVQVGAKDCLPHIVNRVSIILDRLDSSFHNSHASASGPLDEHVNLQALLCGLLLVTIQKLQDQIIPFSNRIMGCLLQVFNARNATADEESFMSVGALAQCLNGDFLVYMQHFGPPLIVGLTNSEEYMVCTVAVGVVGDLCRALSSEMKPFCDDIVRILLQNLQNPSLNRIVKPPVISCFGDIALAIEGDFDRYVEPVMKMLDQATDFCKSVDADDQDTVDYLNQLRESLLEAYTGIVQGLGASQKSNLILPYVARIGEFIQCLAIDQATRNEAVTCGCAGLVGDLAHNLGPQIAPVIKNDCVLQILRECLESSSANSKNVGTWAKQVIQQLGA